MSLLTEVILTCSEDDNETAIQWINNKNAKGALIKVDERLAGGSKYFCHEVYMACFNYLDRETFINWVKLAPWRNPDSVTVLWCRENPDDLGFVVAYQGSE